MGLVDHPSNPLPPGGVEAMVPVTARVRVRTARWLPAGEPRGTVVVLPGRTEFIEKYAEVVADLLTRGFAVAVLDWRGQGGSTRSLRDPRRGHVGHFDEYRADLRAVADVVLRPTCPAPFFGLAHSMGGAIALAEVAGGSTLFQRLVLSAPMLGLSGLRAPQAARRLAAFLTAVGRGGAYIPGGSGRSIMAAPFERNPLTSDPARFKAFAALAEAAPQLLIGDPTVGWVHAAFRVMDGLASADLGRCAVPVLAVACGSDRVVDTPTIERLVGRLKHGRTLVVRHALHEILMERDLYRTQFWAAFDRFVPGSEAAG